ncbi:hypothetical protein M427DRAFT_460970 [Gonapodya prolifera JEL478]|uniref:Uncharacterized protein n=1 Tax=Gonapodya prolifera (strain JEL478) TaxID=1344416 RepID=A0A139A243_GONPJ|nr:hypothetical protein M427DRAFT_460970 [Gonapodya prolifera JEL478]|eukprot:KXS10759.1 hypothetical protein M427DRAFT_460970 [Gonapodya prolifera JEL478]
MHVPRHRAQPSPHLRRRLSPTSRARERVQQSKSSGGLSSHTLTPMPASPPSSPRNNSRARKFGVPRPPQPHPPLRAASNPLPSLSRPHLFAPDHAVSATCVSAKRAGMKRVRAMWREGKGRWAGLVSPTHSSCPTPTLPFPSHAQIASRTMPLFRFSSVPSSPDCRLSVGSGGADVGGQQWTVGTVSCGMLPRTVVSVKWRVVVHETWQLRIV